MFEAYSVGIRLKLLDGVSGGLISMASQFSAFNKHVNTSKTQLKEFETRLKSIKMMGAVGAIAFGAGAAGLYAFKAPLEESKKWLQEAARFASLGFGDKINADAQQFAMGMKTIGTSAVQNLTLLSDAMAVFKDMGHAKIAAPLMAQMKFANEAVFGHEAGAANERSFMDLLKVIEFRRGLSSDTEFATQANFAQQTITGSRGRVNSRDLLQALKTGGVATTRLSNEAFYLGLEPLIQEFGGQRTGTGLMSTYANLVQGRASKAAQHELVRLGLIDTKKIEFNSIGGIKKMLPGAFSGSKTLMTQGPLALLKDVLLPAFAKKGITKEGDVINELGLLLSNRTGSNLLARTYQQMPTIERMVAANRGAANITQLKNIAANTPEGKSLALHAAWGNLMLQLGNDIMPLAIRGLTLLIKIVEKITTFTKEFPGLTKAIVLATATIFTLAAAGGAIAMLTAGFRGLGLVISMGGAAGGLAGKLAGVAGGLGKVSGAVGVFAAAYGVGTWLNNTFELSEKLNDFLDWIGVGGGSGLHKQPRGMPTAKESARVIQVTSEINLDGQRMARVLSTHQAKSAGLPQTGLSGYDWNQMLTPAGQLPNF